MIPSRYLPWKEANDMNRIEENIVFYDASKDRGGWKYLPRETQAGEVAITYSEYPGSLETKQSIIVVDERTAKLMTGQPDEYTTREVK